MSRDRPVLDDPCEADLVKLRLVGGWRLNPPPGDHALLASLFERLPREVCDIGTLTRIVRYETPPHTAPHVQFVGMEVEQVRTVPEDLVTWELSDQEWTVWHGGDGCNAPAWREPIRWAWREVSEKNKWLFGEFAARGPDDWGLAQRGPQPLLLTGSAPVVAGMAAMDQVELVDHDASWPTSFEVFARYLGSELGPQIALRIEHFGSTSIPGMPAKPIIDVLVEIPSFEEAKQVALPRLLGPQWEYWWYADKITLVRRDGLLGRRTHHVHMAPRAHAVWQGIAFRDYLRQNRTEALRYAELKKRLAAACADDREAYTQQKSEFFSEIHRRIGARRGRA